MPHKKDAKVYRIVLLFDNGKKDLFELMEKHSKHSKGKIAYEIFTRALIEMLDKRLDCDLNKLDSYIDMIESSNTGWVADTTIKHTISKNKMKGGLI